jgi:hypothetical protein
MNFCDKVNLFGNGSLSFSKGCCSKFYLSFLSLGSEINSITPNDIIEIIQPTVHVLDLTDMLI